MQLYPSVNLLMVLFIAFLLSVSVIIPDWPDHHRLAALADFEVSACVSGLYFFKSALPWLCRLALPCTIYKRLV